MVGGRPAQGGSHLASSAARRGSDHRDPELESAGWKRMILCVFIHLSSLCIWLTFTPVFNVRAVWVFIRSLVMFL